MKSIYSLSTVAIVALFLNSCSKGDTGPAGNANVSTTTIQVPTASWVENSTSTWEIDYTQSNPVNSSGAMECYYSSDNTNWFQLPWVREGNGDHFEQDWVYTSSSITIKWFDISTQNYLIIPPAISYFMIVAIPPAIMVKYQNTDWNNPSKVA